MSTTTNYGFQKFFGNWFDQNPEKGPIHLVNTALDNIDGVLAAGLVGGAHLATDAARGVPHRS